VEGKEFFYYSNKCNLKKASTEFNYIAKNAYMIGVALTVAG
jgi:hypothetical protein